jgi:hypothetical protein
VGDESEACMSGGSVHVCRCAASQYAVCVCLVASIFVYICLGVECIGGVSVCVYERERKKKRERERERAVGNVSG